MVGLFLFFGLQSVQCQAQGTLVANIDQFQIYVESHSERVRIISLWIRDHFPSRYGVLPRELVDMALRGHDRAKFEQLPRLWSLYGKALKGKDREYIDTVLNPADQIYQHLRFSQALESFRSDRLPISNLKAFGILKELENLADWIDRRSNQHLTAEEFGVRSSLLPSEWIQRFIQGSEHLVFVAQRAQVSYDSIVEGATYPDFLEAAAERSEANGDFLRTQTYRSQAFLTRAAKLQNAYCPGALLKTAR